MVKRVSLAIFLCFFLCTNSLKADSTFLRICGLLLDKISHIIPKKKLSPIHKLADPDKVAVELVPVIDPRHPFSEKNYDPSNYGISSGHKHDQAFLNRAVSTAHAVLESLNNGSKMEDAYLVAIEGRQNLPQGIDAGIRFRDKGRAPLDKLASNSSKVLNDPYRQNLYYHINAIYKLRKSPDNLYTHINGTQTKLASITHSPIGNADVEDTFLRNGRAFEDIRTAFDDIFLRLERASKSTKIEEKIDDFSRAIYGLANCSPLYRGNSSVARDFLTAAAYRIFGKSFKLYSDITLEAMYREEKQFLDMFKPKLREALEPRK